VISRLPIDVVNLLHGQPEPQGQSLRQVHLAFTAAAALVAMGLLVLTWRAVRTRRVRLCTGLLAIAIATVALQAMSFSAAVLFAFARDLALVMAVALARLCLPSALITGAWARCAMASNGQHPP